MTQRYDIEKHGVGYIIIDKWMEKAVSPVLSKDDAEKGCSELNKSKGGEN